MFTKQQQLKAAYCSYILVNPSQTLVNSYMHQKISKLNLFFKFNYCLSPSKVTKQSHCVGLMHIKRQHRQVHNSVPLETPFASMLADKAGETTIWECADFFSQSEQAPTMNESLNELKGSTALIVANFPISPENPFFNNLWDNGTFQILVRFFKLFLHITLCV